MTQDEIMELGEAATTESQGAAPWALDVEPFLLEWQVDLATGLANEAVMRRLERHGYNRLREVESKSAWRILIDQLNSLIVLLLLIAACVSFAFGELIEGIAILAVIGINSCIGFVTELRAVRSMEALRKMGATRAVVRRNGQVQEINADELVPGDIVLLEAGNSISADLRLVEASKFQANESALTGESLPIGKHCAPNPIDAVLADRSNMVYQGTFVTRGAGIGVVVATGMQTELGQISSLVAEASDDSKTPLERRLDSLGRQLVVVTLATTVAVALVGMARGKDTLLMIETGVALAVAAIPEGLPIVATIALAGGMLRLARKKALIRRLSAVETLGATTVICTDKTGTLTENRMTVTQVALMDGVAPIDQGTPASPSSLAAQSPQASQAAANDRTQRLRHVIELGALCTDAALSDTGDESEAVGDPVEIALLLAAKSIGVDPRRLKAAHPRKLEIAFDPDIKLMATFHQATDGLLVAVKGAPEEVLRCCEQTRDADGDRCLTDEDRNRWIELNASMANHGMRILAVATKRVKDHHAPPYQDLVMVGLVGMKDPARKEVRSAIAACRAAGVRVVMVTGDQPLTAQSVALDIGLVANDAEEVLTGKHLKSHREMDQAQRDKIIATTLFARVSPKNKLDLIEAHQASGEIVAMTGDGVNDAAALEKADIGVAMGKRGTQVAREAADMVLEDDSFSTIVVAIEQGRIIFGNIRKFVVYLLSCNVSEVLVVGCASLLNVPMPVLPLQILFLNLVTDVFPALALGVGRGDPRIMTQPPRDPQEAVLPPTLWWTIGGYAALISMAVLGALWLGHQWFHWDAQQAGTVSFLTLAMAQLWHVFNMRDKNSHLWMNDITKNVYVWMAIGICVALLLLAVNLPGLASVLKLSPPGKIGWGVAFGMSLIPCATGMLVHVLRPRAKP